MVERGGEGREANMIHVKVDWWSNYISYLCNLSCSVTYQNKNYIS